MPTQSTPTTPHSVVLRLPYPPTVNHYYRPGKGGRRYLKKESIAYRAEVGNAILEQHGHIRTLTGRLDFVAYMTPPDRRKRDIDNLRKAIWDSLQHNNVFVNDSQIDDDRMKRLAPKSPGSILVILVEYADTLPWISP